MRIARIELENIHGFEHLDVDLCPGEEPSAWSVILGDHGTGKSTLLRGIALGLSSPKTSGALLEEAGGSWLRHGTTEGRVKITFDNGQASEVEIRMESYGETIARHRALPDEPLWDQLFVCGYGAGRRAFGDKSYREYSIRDAVLSLFDPDARLQNPELMLRRLVSVNGPSQGDDRSLLRQIDSLLMLEPGSTRLDVAGLEVRGPWGTFTPVGALGDGYKATLAWILDLLGWAMLRDAGMLQSGIRGIVLIDEIEQHLHPQWQRRILSLLHRQFPLVQFIATTHSPLCAIGTTDFKDEEVSLVLLRQAGQRVEAQSHLKPPRGLRADQVLTSYLFGLQTTGDDQTQEEIELLSKLLSRPERTPEEERRVRQLRESLRQKLGSGETELERQVAPRVRESLEENLRDLVSDLTSRRGPAVRSPSPRTPSVVDFEVKRQLKKILGQS